jgi:hypothetical protein
MYVIAYPDYRVQFFSNNTFVSDSGKYRVISGPKDRLTDNDMVLAGSYDMVLAGIWYNEGDGNYSIKFLYHDGYCVYGDPENESVTYRLKDGYIKDTMPRMHFDDPDYKLIRLSR